MMLHAADALKGEYKKAMIIATDTEWCSGTSYCNSKCLAWWMSALACIWTWVHFWYISAHDIAVHLGKEWSWGLLYRHAFCECDTISSFNGIGKKIALKVWRSLPQLKQVFKQLSQAPPEITDEDMDEQERLLCSPPIQQIIFYYSSERGKKILLCVWE